MEYRIIHGNAYEVETEVNNLLRDHFEIVGILVPYDSGYVAQVMIKRIMEIDPTGKHEKDPCGYRMPEGQTINP